MDAIWADLFMAFRSLLTSAIVFSLAYALLPFEERTKKKAILWTVVLAFLGSAALTLIYHFNPSNTTLLGTLFVPLLLVIGSALIFAFFHQDLPYSFFCFVLVMTIYLIIGFPSELLKNALAAQPYLANVLYLTLRLVILAILLPFFLFFLRPRLLAVEIELRHHWLLPLVLASLVFLLLVFIGVFPVDWSKRDASNLFLIGYSGVFVIGFYVSIYYFIQSLIRQKRKELEQQAMSKKIEALESKIGQDERYQAIIDQKEHDLHHHIAALKGLLANGKSEEALAYLHQYDEDNPPAKKPFRTGSSALDALLAMYFSRYEKEKIDFTCQLLLPSSFPLNENEIIALFANALENALNGAKLAAAEKPFVSLQGRQEKGFYSLTLENSAPQRFFQRGNPFKKRFFARDRHPKHHSDSRQTSGFLFLPLSIRRLSLRRGAASCSSSRMKIGQKGFGNLFFPLMGNRQLFAIAEGEKIVLESFDVFKVDDIGTR